MTADVGRMLVARFPTTEESDVRAAIVIALVRIPNVSAPTSFTMMIRLTTVLLGCLGIPFKMHPTIALSTAISSHLWPTF